MRVGEIVGEDLAAEGKPLDGVRILAIEQMQAMPFATQLLAQMGAEVVKVEHPVHGESARGSQPPVHDTDGQDVGPTYLRNNLCKKSICVDLKQPEGVELIKRLAPRFDVLGENFKAGTLQRLGLGYEVLSEIHPALVYVSVSGFGNLGESPYRSWGAYAPIAEAMGGFYEMNRSSPDERLRPGVAGALGDIGSSLFAAIGILTALRHRDRTGRGQHVDVAMYDAMVAMADVVPFFWSMGMRGSKEGRRRGVVDVFQAKDGFFMLQCVRDHQLEALARAVGHPEWIGDPRLPDRLAWAREVESLIRPGIEGWAKDMTILEACTQLNAQGVACGPCNGPEHVIGDPHVKSHNMLIEVPRPDSDEPLLVVGNPIKLSRSAEGPVTRWPTLGQHTAEILESELGMSASEIEDLRQRGVV
ncbi:MAG: CoA transferase [Proteobacteria bacterium]|nr:CoA transferase [Pseudomonadota bacterium]